MQTDQAVFLLNILLPAVESEAQTTKKVIAAIPEGKAGYRPDPKSKNADELAWHLASSDIWFLDGIASGKFAEGEPERPAALKTPADLVAWYETNFAAGIDRVKAMAPEKLAETLSFYGIFNHPAVMYLSLLMVHAVHHRGQLSTYIRPMGGKVPSIYGGSADEPFQMPESA
jgi:uncharacterized damage-inducible protein DinB